MRPFLTFNRQCACSPTIQQKPMRVRTGFLIRGLTPHASFNISCGVHNKDTRAAVLTAVLLL